MIQTFGWEFIPLFGREKVEKIEREKSAR